MDVSTISIAEAEAAGLSTIVHSGETDPDNSLVDMLWSGNAAPQQDRDGRQIISYKQYKEFLKRGGRLDNYAMRMTWPGSRRVQMIQATKFHKWWGYGYIPVGITKEEIRGMSEEAQLRFKAAGMLENVKVSSDGGTLEDAETVIFRCNSDSKYPECRRFFDSSKGLAAHRRLDHKEGLGKE